MSKLIILGSGAATGVPSISGGWGACKKDNPKNKRQRAGIYFDDNGTQILIDTSPDLKNQLIDCRIRTLDAVLYTHTHADHLHGIDDLRGITRNLRGSLNIYASPEHLAEIQERFSYVFSNAEHTDITNHPELLANEFTAYETFKVKNTEILPLKFAGHSIPTYGFMFNRGQVVIVPDFRIIPDETLHILQNIDVNVLIIPLTIIHESAYHAGIETVLRYIGEIRAKKVIITHMAAQCDYQDIDRITPQNVHPAYDYLTLDL